VLLPPVECAEEEGLLTVDEDMTTCQASAKGMNEEEKELRKKLWSKVFHYFACCGGWLLCTAVAQVVTPVTRKRAMWYG
jgi:hypothetical protein